MAIFPFFSKKKQPILVRCTYCYDEFYLSPREVRLLETKNADDPVCPVKEECDMCHIGFMIPVNYTNNLGKTYLFHETKPKIKNLDPNTVMERIFGHGFCEFEIPEHRGREKSLSSLVQSSTIEPKQYFTRISFSCKTKTGVFIFSRVFFLDSYAHFHIMIFSLYPSSL